MKYLLIHQAFATPEQSGGTRHYEFAQYLKQQGHNFRIITSDTNYLTGKRLTTASRLTTEQDFDGVNVLRAWTFSSLHRSFAHRLIAFFSFMVTSILVALRTGRADVVVGTSPPLFQGLSAWMVSVIWQVPFLLEIRDLWPEFAIDMGVLKSPLLIRMSRWLESFLYARANHLLVNSPAYKDYLITKGVPSSKISLIPNGVDPDLFPTAIDGRALRESLGLGDKFIAIYAGALGMANDIDTLLRAAKQLESNNEIHILLAGDGKERFRLEHMAEELGLKNLTFIGAQPKTFIPQILGASDVGIAILKNIPMFRTTYPNKVFDYMAAGRPTVLAIDGVIREVIETAEAGLFVPPGDEFLLAEALRELSQDREKARVMGIKARTYVEKYFNRHQHSQEFCELLENMAQHNEKF